MIETMDWFLLAVIAIAFITGYAIVSFIIGKLKARHQPINRSYRTYSDKNSESEANSAYTREQREDADSHSNRTQQEDQDQRWREEEARHRSKTWDSQSEERRYARVLGLKERATASDVKQAYRTLLAKYHPDKVNHLGDEFQQLAAERTREILVAYEYFRKKYNIT